MIRVGIIWFLFLLSLLTVFKAPAYYLWLLAIGVTEFPWVFIGFSLLLLIAGYWVQKYQLASTLIALVALLMFLSPRASTPDLRAVSAAVSIVDQLLMQP